VLGDISILVTPKDDDVTVKNDGITVKRIVLEVEISIEILFGH